MKPAAESRPSFSGALKPRRLAAPPARSGFDPRCSPFSANRGSNPDRAGGDGRRLGFNAPEKEGRLSAAGFMRLHADTPQKMAKLQALPQDTIVYAPRKNGNAYIFADAAGCACAFVGNEAAYQQYQQIRAANN